MTTWLVVGVVGLATMAIKAAGPALLGGKPLPERLGRIVGLLAPALLAALLVTQVFGGDRQLVLDARAAGVAVAALVLAFRAPTILVIASAAVVTALVRLM